MLKLSLRPLIMLLCCGLLVSGLLSGCLPGGKKKADKEQEKTIEMSVLQLDQLNRMGTKVADGQYVVAKVAFKNLSNETVELDGKDFILENVSENEEERYSQPAERSMASHFAKQFGKELRDKVMERGATLHPRMTAERFFVFMLPSEVRLSDYQITYEPEKTSVPLKSAETPVNDHRNASAYR